MIIKVGAEPNGCTLYGTGVVEKSSMYSIIDELLAVQWLIGLSRRVLYEVQDFLRIIRLHI